MKAIIPVAGAGKRLRPHTYTQPKPLIPVAGKPIIALIIDQMLAVGVDEFVFIIGYLGEKIQSFVEETYPELDTTFIIQVERKGLGHAIWTARDAFREESEIIIMLGDSIVDGDFQKLMDADQSTLMIKKVAEPGSFGVVEMNADGRIIRMVEKPKIPKSNKAVVGVYKIKEVKALLDAIQYNIDNDITTHGEYQLTDGLMRMIELGAHIGTMKVDNWFDCGKKEVLLKTNKTLLDKDGYPTTDLPAYFNSIIIHPVSIGKNCDIQNAVIGPHVTISDHAVIHNSIIKNSIIGRYAKIDDIVMDDSIIGNDASVKGAHQSLNLGDNTEIDLG